jgi:hydrogenase maturation protein HypF
MHEMSLLRGLIKQIDAIARDNDASRVTSVRLKLGPLAHIEPDHLREHFVEAAHGTVAEYAVLEIETTDELHELTLESVDVEEIVPHDSRNSAVLPLPAIEALARRRGHERGHDCPPCLATGGHLKVALAAWTGTRAFLTPPIGQMDDVLERAAFGATVAELTKRHRFQPATIACDLHPDYYTTRWATEQAKQVIQVQHHHAHAVACMVEHDLLDREVIGVTWDGTGFGPDDTIWGGEILHASVRGFQRVGSLTPFPLPGGEAAIRRPNRIAFGMLVQSRGTSEVLRDARMQERLGLSEREGNVITSMIDRRINTPRTSSVGRLFDAVSALALGIHKVDFEGAAAIRLEAVADPAVRDTYDMPVAGGTSTDGVSRADWRPLLAAVVDDCFAEIEPRVIAGRFHNTLARWVAAVVANQPLRDVVLSGGCFLNKLLTERVVEAVTGTGRRVFWHEKISPGDAGIAAGQLAIAMGC